MSDESTRTLLFGTLVVAARPLTTGQIIALAEPLRISATNVKTHLSRMVADGSIRRSGRRRFAQYSPATDGQDRIQAIAARLNVNERETWDGRWLLLTVRLPEDRRERSQVRQSLWFDGFRPWSTDVHLRPAWPTPWAITRAEGYVQSGVALCLHGELLGVLDGRRVRAMYGVDALDLAAAQLADKIDALCSRKRSAGDAFAARLNVGGRVARLIAHDPRLPDAIWQSRTGMRKLRRAYRRFEARVGSQAQEFIDLIIGVRSRSSPAGRTEHRRS